MYPARSRHNGRAADPSSPQGRGRTTTPRPTRPVERVAGLRWLGAFVAFFLGGMVPVSIALIFVLVFAMVFAFPASQWIRPRSSGWGSS